MCRSYKYIRIRGVMIVRVFVNGGQWWWLQRERGPRNRCERPELEGRASLERRVGLVPCAAFCFRDRSSKSSARNTLPARAASRAHRKFEFCHHTRSHACSQARLSITRPTLPQLHHQSEPRCQISPSVTRSNYLPYLLAAR